MFNPDSQHPECFWGWDSQSVFGWSVIVADDFLCDNEKPITDIHWWGSYVGWPEPVPPPLPGAPIAFHIGLWTDVPAGVDAPWSHPGIMIREWVPPIEELNETLVGCDFQNEWPSVYDYCYRYDFTIPEAEWFHQEPGCTVYWISIAAIYPEPDPGAFEWGWKTREHYFNDDAVQIFWPTAPGLGMEFVEGVPIREGWDLAFVLTTEDGGPNQPDIPPYPHDVRKNRYISIDAATNAAKDGRATVALEVSLTSMKRCDGDLRLPCITDVDCPEGEICVEHPDVGAVTKWVDWPFESNCIPLYDCYECTLSGANCNPDAGRACYSDHDKPCLVDADCGPDGPCRYKYCDYEDEGDCAPIMWFAHLTETPVYRVWTESILHITDCQIVPVATYEVVAVDGGGARSDPLKVGTILNPNLHYADCVGPASGVPPQWGPPDRIVSVVDIQACKHGIQGEPTVPHTTWLDIHGVKAGPYCEPPNVDCVVPQQILNVADMQTIQFGFYGQTYTETPGQNDPGSCP